MQLTLEAELRDLTEADRAGLDDLMRRYCTAKRVAYCMLLQARGIGEVVHRLETLPSLHLNWRYCDHAAKDALANLKSQRELLPIYLHDVYVKIEDTEGRLKTLNGRKAKHDRISLLEALLSSLNKRKVFLERHVVDRTVPKVVFGSRRLFVARAQGRVTLERWRDARNNQFYSIGQANQGGNANVRISLQMSKIGINFPEWVEAKATKKGIVRVRSKRRWFGLQVPIWSKGYFFVAVAAGSAYSVRVARRDGRYFALVSFEIHNAYVGGLPQRVPSVDSNPRGFAATVVSSDGNLLSHRFFRDNRLIDASEKKRDSIIGGIISDLLSYARRKGAGAIVVENLSITGSKSFGRKVNRVVYAFVRKKFLQNLLSGSWKEQIPVFTVGPAYTSKLGGAKYKHKFGLSIHEAAALCIGRRFYGHGERLDEPMTITVESRGEKVRPRVKYLWPSIYSHQCPSDPYMEPPGRKGSRETKAGDGDVAVFTGRPSSRMTPLTRWDEGVRKGGECGGSPQTTGHGGTPAPSSCGGGKVIATPLRAIRDAL